MAARFESGRLDGDAGEFGLRVAELEVAYTTELRTALPRERIQIEARRPIRVVASTALEDGALAERTPQHWSIRAPSRVGVYTFEVGAPSSGTRASSDAATRTTLEPGPGAARIHLFVLRPATEIRKGWLGSYRIGAYERKPFRGLAAYEAPRGFIEVRPEHVGLAVSPHFRLGQFLCKQESEWPKYLVLRPELLFKLEHTLERLNQHGLQVSGFEVMSGYRTPWYNRSIGNRTSSSRHLYGGAADIFIDQSPRDGQMDDLNGDGRVDKADADFLYDLLEQWSSEPRWQRFPGGLAAYAPNPAHGPFVHIDARGYRARWGR